jgi:carboxylesterase type B
MNPLVDPIKIFAPSVEVGDPNDPNTFLAEHPYKILEEGRAYRVPYITGLNSEEGLYLNGRIMNNPRLIKLIETRWDDISAQFLQYNASNKEITEKIKQFYNLNSAAVQENTLTKLENETSKTDLLDFNYFEEFHKLTNIFSDRMYNTATRESVRLQAQFSPVYTYYNSYQGEWCFVTTFVSDDEDANCDQPPSRYTSPWWKENIELKSRPNYGVSHADELPFFFNYTGAREINSTCVDYQISLDLVKLWVDFAYNSTNMTFRGSQWKPVDPRAPTMKYLSITNDIQHSAHHSTCAGEGEIKAQSNHSLLIDEPILERIKFWESLKLPTYGIDFDNGLNLDVDHLLLLDNIKVKLPTAEILKLEPNALLSSTINLIDTKSNIL